METAFLYVGADNDTHIVDVDRITTLLDKEYESYTIVPATGRWHGMSEESTVIVLTGERDDIMHTAHTLCSELSQDAVAVQFMPAMQLVTP